MAGRTLSREDLGQLLPTEPGRPLGIMYLHDAEDQLAWRCTAFLLRIRRGGFMVCLPMEDRITELLRAFSEADGEDTMLSRTARVQAETPRRRAVGELEVHLADFPWSYLTLFRRAVTGNRPAQIELVAMKKDGTVVRPIRESAIEAAETWISEVADDPALLEYMTAESHPESEADEDAEIAGDPQADEITQLRAEVAELRARTAPPQDVQRPGAQRGARTLFPESGPGVPAALSEAQWAQLRTAAGTAPPRMARHERQPRATGGGMGDAELAEVEAGARPEDPSGEGSLLQQLLATQTKLLERIAGRTSDPITAALSGPSGSSEPGMGSAKGITAREAYIKLMQQQPAQVTSSIRAAAATELGLDVLNPPSSLMQSYVERRMAIGDHRQIALFAHFMAHAWACARESGNEELEHWMSRGLLMADQFAVDQGKTTMGWLLGALPDPNRDARVSNHTPGWQRAPG